MNTSRSGLNVRAAGSARRPGPRRHPGGPARRRAGSFFSRQPGGGAETGRSPDRAGSRSPAAARRVLSSAIVRSGSAATSARSALAVRREGRAASSRRSDRARPCPHRWPPYPSSQLEITTTPRRPIPLSIPLMRLPLSDSVSPTAGGSNGRGSRKRRSTFAVMRETLLSQPLCGEAPAPGDRAGGEHRAAVAASRRRPCRRARAGSACRSGRCS